MGLNHLSEVLWPLAGLTVAIALTATAIVQLLKELLPIRRYFQRSFLATWFSKRLAEVNKPVTPEQLKAAEKDLVHLATGGGRNAFYNLETPQLCGQMNAAAQIALAYPERHPDLLRFLAPEADEADGEGAENYGDLLIDIKHAVNPVRFQRVLSSQPPPVRRTAVACMEVAQKLRKVSRSNQSMQPTASRRTPSLSDD